MLSSATRSRAGSRRSLDGRRTSSRPTGSDSSRTSTNGCWQRPEPSRHLITDRGDAMSTTASKTDFKVADLQLADFGRKEIRLADHEMPGLMATRREYADRQPLAGAQI